MQTKLTLRLEEAVIEKAKSYSRETGKSLSQIVSDHFALLTEPRGEEETRLTPLVRSLKGALKGASVDEEDYRRHLEEKHR